MLAIGSSYMRYESKYNTAIATFSAKAIYKLCNSINNKHEAKKSLESWLFSGCETVWQNELME